MDSFTLSAEELRKSLLELQYKNELGISNYKAGIDKLKTDLRTNGQREITAIILRMDRDEKRLQEIENVELGPSKELQKNLQSNLETAQSLIEIIEQTKCFSITKEKEIQKNIEDLKSFLSDIDKGEPIEWTQERETKIKQRLGIHDVHVPLLQAQVSVSQNPPVSLEVPSPSLESIKFLKEIKIPSSNNMDIVLGENDSIWVSKNKGQVVQLSKHGDILAKFFTREVHDWLEINEMQGLTINKSGHLLTTDKSRKLVSQFNPQQKTSMDLIHCGEWYPTGGICLTDDRIYISLANDNGGKIGCYTLTGDLAHSIEKSSTGKALFTHPWYITIHRQSSLCVSDKSKKFVSVVSLTGVQEGTYCPRKDSFIPYGITTDKFNRILVADAENSKIHILSENCELLLLIKCKENGLSKPISLCLDSEGHLWVGNGEKGVLKLLQYYG